MANCPCEPKLVGLAQLGEHPAIIISAYLVVIFPWGIMQNIDFISEKWRTIHHSRHLAHLHLALSIVPLPYIILYAHLQQISGDYKEMMASVVVILMVIYHIIRTIWGLMQLDAYHTWSIDLIKRMMALKMVPDDYWKGEACYAEVGRWNRLKQKLGGLFAKKNSRASSDEESTDSGRSDGGESIVDSGEVLKSFGGLLKVNNEVVDNELGGTDLSVWLDWTKVGLRRPTEWLKTEAAELCFARWSAAFLCEFGHFWGDPKNPYDNDARELVQELFSSCPHSLYALHRVTFSENGARSRIPVFDDDMVEPQTCGAFGSYMGGVEWDDRETVVGNIASGYPTDCAGYRYVHIDLVYEILNVKLMTYPSLESFGKYISTFFTPSPSNGWHLLLWQVRELPSDKRSKIWKLHDTMPFPWNRLSVPLWDVFTNWRVLQATVHVDNCFLIPGNTSPSIHLGACFFESSRKIVAEIDLIDHHKFTGCVLEMVRTFLADWLHTRPSDAPAPNWTPALPTEAIEFQFPRFWYTDVLWDCQSRLQESIANMERSDKNMAASPHLIMLFILAFPGIDSYSMSNPSTTGDIISIPQSQEPSPGSDDDTVCMYYSPFAPQDVKLHVKERTNNGETKTIMKLVAGNSVETFLWADWIDAAMGYMKGLDDWELKDPQIPEHVRNWRKRTPSKCDLSRPLLDIPKGHPELPDMPGDIRVWTGWPIFDIKLVQFEMNQWVQASGLVRGFGEPVLPKGQNWEEDLKKEVERAEEGLLKLMEWKRN